MKKKWLAVGIILLFLGVAVAPSINFTVAKASQDDDLVEVTTQACGIQGFGNTTVKLTREQYQNLEQYLVDFRTRLNQTTTREEVKKLYNEFIVELNEYRLLGRLTIKQAQFLTTGLFADSKISMLLERYLYTKDLSSDYINALCFIYGENQENIFFQGPIAQLPSRILGFFTWGLGIISIFFIILGLMYILPGLIFATNINPFQIFSTIFYGYKQFPFMDWEGQWRTYPAIGNVWTLGLFGIKYWNGSFIGKIPTLLYLTLAFDEILPGAVGFTGLRISSNSSNFYFGSALLVQFDYVTTN